MASRSTTRTPDDSRTRRTQRAFSRRQWGRRWLTWKYVVAALLAVGLLVGGVWLFFFSTVLAVKQVDITGTDHVRPGQVLAVAGLEDGDPLARVDLGSVASRVGAIAAVRDVDVTRKWPDTVLIAVEERVPIASIDVGGQKRALDLEGQVFDQDPKVLADLPRVETSGGADRAALEEAATVVSALPEDLAATVDHVEVVTVDQVSLVLRDDRVVLWGSAEESELKAEVLAALLDRPGSTYDVSVPGQATVRP